MAATAQHSIPADMAKGAVAGLAGSWAMDQVTSYIMNREGSRAIQREKRARIHGKTAPELTAKRLSSRTGMDIRPQVIHYAAGMVPAMFYGILLDRFDRIGFARGLLYGATVFVLVDELMTPMMRVANKPTAYPWQTHARGLAGHLVLGAVTYGIFKLLNR